MKPAPARYSLPSLRIIAIGWACLLLSCEGNPPPRPSTSTIQKSVQVPSSPGPKVMYRGCRVVQKTPDGPLCLQAATSRTVLWVEGTPCEQLEVRDDKQPVAVDANYVEGGCQLKQKEPSKSVRSLLSLHNRKTATDFWSLPTDRSKPWLMEWTDRMWRRESVDLAGTEAELQAQALQQPVPEVQLDLLMARAVVLFRVGALDASMLVASQVIEIARQYGYDTTAFAAARMRWNMLERAGMLEDAWAELQDIKPLIQNGLTGYELAWKLDAGFLSMLMERYQDAEQYFRRCEAESDRLDMPFYSRYALPYHASVQLSLDQFDEAWLTQQRAMKLIDKLSDCPKSELQLLLANNILQFAKDVGNANRVDGCDLKQSHLLFSQSLALKKKCTNNVGESLVGLAEVLISQNRAKEALSYLDDAERAVGMIYRDKLRTNELRGKIALSEGRPTEAQSYFERMRSILSDARAGHAGAVDCKADVGIWESSLLQGKRDHEASQRVEACIDFESLSPRDRRLLREKVASVREKFR